MQSTTQSAFQSHLASCEITSRLWHLEVSSVPGRYHMNTLSMFILEASTLTLAGHKSKFFFLFYLKDKIIFVPMYVTYLHIFIQLMYNNRVTTPTLLNFAVRKIYNFTLQS